jgi:hypothetical protein
MYAGGITELLCGAEQCTYWTAASTRHMYVQLTAPSTAANLLKLSQVVANLSQARANTGLRRLALEIIAHSLEAAQLADLLADFKKVQFTAISISVILRVCASALTGVVAISTLSYRHRQYHSTPDKGKMRDTC